MKHLPRNEILGVSRLGCPIFIQFSESLKFLWFQTWHNSQTKGAASHTLIFIRRKWTISILFSLHAKVLPEKTGKTHASCWHYDFVILKKNNHNIIVNFLIFPKNNMLVIHNFLWGKSPLDPQQKNTKQLPTTVTSHPHGVFHRPGQTLILPDWPLTAVMQSQGFSALAELSCRFG